MLKPHQVKTLIFKLLDVLPKQIGYAIYHYIQKRSFKTIDSKIKANTHSFSVITDILTNNNIDLNAKVILEIGSGWLPIMPYLFKINSTIDTIYTYDINTHYNVDNIKKVADYYNPQNKLNFKNHTSQGFKLPDFIHYHPNCNIIHANLPSDISLYFSRFVLEHVTPTDIKNMHQKLYDTMPSNACILHLISPSDHRAYSDKSLSYYDFLKYSQKEWDRIQTKFDYHNRLRLPQYLAIFKAIGFEIVHVEHDSVDKRSEKYQMFKALNLHSDFTKFTEEELLAGSINILLKKP